MSVGPWKIALFSTNNKFTIDANSEISLATLGTSDPMTDANWMKIDVYGISPHNEQLSDKDKRVGSISVHRGKQVETFNVQVEYFVFPTDMAKYKALFALLSRKNVYLYRGEYEFSADSWNIHSTGKAIAIAVNGSTEDDYDGGVKKLTLSCTKTNPSPRAT